MALPPDFQTQWSPRCAGCTDTCVLMEGTACTHVCRQAAIDLVVLNTQIIPPRNFFWPKVLAHGGGGIIGGGIVLQNSLKSI